MESGLTRLEAVVALAERAGAAILEVYASSADAQEVTRKSDESPLTLADRVSHGIIVAGLAALTPGIPVISEEGDAGEAAGIGLALRWVVDPLDGTKEFLKRTGEFTVNIALVDGTRPVAGVVHAPVLGVTWTGADGSATRREGMERRTLRTTAAPDTEALRVVASRDHAGPAVRALLARLPGARTLSMGSSLKFCLVAEGEADLYLRDGPTMEWDTAAAQAVVEAAGGAVLGPDGAALAYGKRDLRNPSFVALGSLALDWRSLVGPDAFASPSTPAPKP